MIDVRKKNTSLHFCSMFEPSFFKDAGCQLQPSLKIAVRVWRQYDTLLTTLFRNLFYNIRLPQNNAPDDSTIESTTLGDLVLSLSNFLSLQKEVSSITRSVLAALFGHKFYYSYQGTHVPESIKGKVVLRECRIWRASDLENSSYLDPPYR